MIHDWAVHIVAYCRDKEDLNFPLMKASNSLRNVLKHVCLMQLKKILPSFSKIITKMIFGNTRNLPKR